MPKILTDKFGVNQFWSGVIMALDNVLALFLLPYFLRHRVEQECVYLWRNMMGKELGPIGSVAKQTEQIKETATG